MMHRKPQGISALISRMEAEGLVTKKRYPKNRHQVRISMMKRGEETCRHLSQVAAKGVARTLAERARVLAWYLRQVAG